MKRIYRFLLGLFVAASLLACRSEPRTAPRISARAFPTSAPALPLSDSKAGEITVEQIALMLPRHPVVVGFDVDDTLVFSAPAFDALQPQYDPDVIRPKKAIESLSPDQRAKYHEFWNRLNLEFDDRSIPKKIGQRLLDLHLARGDTIYVISRRQSIVPAPKTDVVTARYERMFGITLKNPVVQTQLKDKTPYIGERHIDYYYGDSDSDITAAVAGGAVPIRVKRGSGSYAQDKPHNGQLGEIVIKDSEE